MFVRPHKNTVDLCLHLFNNICKFTRTEKKSVTVWKVEKWTIYADAQA